MIESILWPRIEVRKVLKARSKIDVRELSELERLIEEKAEKREIVKTRTLLGTWSNPKRWF